MAVRDILLDTNAYVAFKQGRADAVEVVQHAPRIGLNSIVLGELLSGFSLGTREQANRQELEQFLASDRVDQIGIDLSTAEHYATVYRDLRQRGRPIPTNDIWIAATALQHDLVIFSYDRHFREVAGLLLGSRLADFIF